jgi:hypothetical protein
MDSKQTESNTKLDTNHDTSFDDLIIPAPKFDKVLKLTEFVQIIANGETDKYATAVIICRPSPHKLVPKGTLISSGISYIAKPIGVLFYDKAEKRQLSLGYSKLDEMKATKFFVGTNDSRKFQNPDLPAPQGFLINIDLKQLTWKTGITYYKFYINENIDASISQKIKDVEEQYNLVTMKFPTPTAEDLLDF